MKLGTYIEGLDKWLSNDSIETMQDPTFISEFSTRRHGPSQDPERGFWQDLNTNCSTPTKEDAEKKGFRGVWNALFIH